MGLLRVKLAEVARTGSRSERALSTFMVNSLAVLPFETAGSIAEKVGVSEATVGRFCRSIGFANFRDLKEQLKDDLGDGPWLISDRLAEMRTRVDERGRERAQGLDLEIASLVAVYEMTRLPEWQRATRRLAETGRIFVAGFQTERGIAQYMVAQLQYIRDGVQLLDLAGGNFAEILASPPDGALLIFEARRYSRLARLLAAEARRAGWPVTLVTDPHCAWGPDNSDEMFAISTQFNQFWDSTAHMAIFANLMIHDIFLLLGQEAESRLGEIARLYGAFTGHVGDPVVQVAR